MGAEGYDIIFSSLSQNKHNPKDSVDNFFLALRATEKVPVSTTSKAYVMIIKKLYNLAIQ